MMELTRVCKSCKKDIEYKSDKAYILACKKDSICSQCSRIKNNKNQRKFNLDFLIEETLESAYFLGLIIADGYLNENNFEITLQKRDSEVLFPRLSELCGGLSIKHRIINGVEYDRIMFKNKESVSKIIDKFGFKKRKTYNPLDFIKFDGYEREFLLSLLVGVIDGDGYIYSSPDKKVTNITLTFHKSWEKFYISLLKKIGIKHAKGYIVNNTMVIRISRKEHLIELGKFTKEKLSTKLNRKWQKLQSL